MLIAIAFATFLATLVGGLFALRFKDKLHLILGFSAGAVLGVAFFDLLPESIELGQDIWSASTLASLIALGFFIYLLLDRLIFLHVHEHESTNSEHSEILKGNIKRGVLGAGSLSIHSFFDGIVVGLAFQASTVVGLVVTIAVLAHDFSDGINTVNMILKNHGSRKYAFRWLLLDALAPVVGIVSTLFFTLPSQALAIILSIFCGFFIYIGASDLVPESHHSHPKILTTVMTILGAAVLYVLITLLA